MVKNTNSFNSIKVGRKEVDVLLKRYSIKEIETSLIKIFLEDNNFKTKNKLLLNVLKKNHKKTKKEIKQFLDNKKIKLNLKIIERFFELLIEPEDRKLNGAFYTSTFIVDYIVKETIKDNEKVCDLSCGSGAFLIGATDRINKITKKPIIKIIENNIFGADISKTSVYRSKILLSLFALINKEDKKEIKFNLISTDSLSYNWKRKYPKGFDVIIGNPPYVRIQNMTGKSRKDINKKYFTASKFNIDLFIPFFELGLSLLNDNGKMGYITPNSYLNSHASRKLRDYLQQKGYIKKLLDFNHLQLFEGVTTYTCITILNKKRKNNFNYALIHDFNYLNNLNKVKFTNISIKSLNPSKWNLLTNNDYDNIKKIEKAGMPLGKLTQIKNGIATLKDELYILNGKSSNGYYIKEFDKKEYPIEKEITRKLIKASVLKTKEDIKNTKSKIIFPYEKKDNLYKPIPEKKLKNKYPKCYKYFLAIKSELSKRDRGKREYDVWYAYGRVQGYNISGDKIISPLMSPEPRFVLCKENKTLYNGGIGIFYSGNLKLLTKILHSKVFWYYIKKTSKEYKSSFRSVTKNFIGNFGLIGLNDNEKKFILKSSKKKVDNFLIKKYDLNLI